MKTEKFKPCHQRIWQPLTRETPWYTKYKSLTHPFLSCIFPWGSGEPKITVGALIAWLFKTQSKELSRKEWVAIYFPYGFLTQRNERKTALCGSDTYDSPVFQQISETLFPQINCYCITQRQERLSKVWGSFWNESLNYLSRENENGILLFPLQDTISCFPNTPSNPRQSSMCSLQNCLCY